MAKSPSKVLIVDDHPLLREGMKLRLGLDPEFEVCGEAATLADALRLAEQLRPDIATIDMGLPDGDGLTLIRQLREQMPQIICLVVSAYDERVFAERALRAGAVAYVNKRDSADVIIALRAARAGKRQGRATPRGISGDSAAAPQRAMNLTDRETEVLTLIGEGRKSGEIAARLGLSLSTVDTYRARLKEKFEVRNSAELSRIAVQWLMDVMK